MAYYKSKEDGIVIIYAVTPKRLYVIEIYLDNRWNYSAKKAARKKLISETIMMLKEKYGLSPEEQIIGDDSPRFKNLNPAAPIGRRMLDMRKGK